MGTVGEQPLVEEEVGGVKPEHQVIDGGALLDEGVQPVVQASRLRWAGELLPVDPEPHSAGGEHFADRAPRGLPEVRLAVDVEEADAHVEPVHRRGGVAGREGEAALHPVEAAEQRLAELERERVPDRVLRDLARVDEDLPQRHLGGELLLEGLGVLVLGDHPHVHQELGEVLARRVAPGLDHRAFPDDHLVPFVRALDQKRAGRLPVAQIGHQVPERHGRKVAQEAAHER